MELCKKGSLSSEEVEKIVKDHLEKILGTKVTSMNARTKKEYDPGDWRGECPPTTVFDGYSFEAQDYYKVTIESKGYP